MFTVAFLRGAAERAVKTFAQAAIAVLGADTAGLLEVDLVNLVSVAGLAAVVSLFTSVASHDFVAGHVADTYPDA